MCVLWREERAREKGSYRVGIMTLLSTLKNCVCGCVKRVGSGKAPSELYTPPHLKTSHHFQWPLQWHGTKHLIGNSSRHH